MHRIKPREVRLIRGDGCYWAVGTHRVARLDPACVGVDGDLSAEAQSAVETANLSPAPAQELFHVTVVVTTRCNLACAYCFQNTEVPGPDRSGAPARIPTATVSADLVPRILDFTRRRMLRCGATKLDLMLFGGEPTLRTDVCVQLLVGARELGLVSASMVTNGTLLTANAVARLAQAGLSSAQVTFDGDLAVHDRIRVTTAGYGTFDRIVGNLAAAQDVLDHWGLRINLTRASLSGSRALLDRLADRLDARRFSVYFALVNDAGIGFSDTLEGSLDLGRRVGELTLHAMDLGFTVPLPGSKACLACGVVGGETGAVINADGTLYSCWESAGQEGYEVGTIDTGYLSSETIDPRWVSCGYSAQQPPDDAFADTVHAMVLDRLYADGTLRNAVRRRACAVMLA